MVQSITKRDGRTVDFDIAKISEAINKAFEASTAHGDEKYAEFLANKVLYDIEEQSLEKPSVEQIQDSVERVLINNGHVRTAKAYILYRSKRSRIREMNTDLMRIYEHRIRT